ncbi:hypothetical protein IJG93_03825 [Candidatus Saccharibacteria bacterium]|nr:hypothetical protein [Candidatus Saccharibacteria bacterium]
MARKKGPTIAQKMSGLKIWQLLIGLVLVVGGTTVFVVLVSGALGGSSVMLDSEYLCGESCDGEYMELEPATYESLIADGKSFVVFVDQGGCTTADRLEGYVKDYGVSHGFKVYRMMFEDMKKTSLHEFIKYYPSVAVISRGKVVGYLRADTDEDSDAYNKYEAFEEWMGKYLK